ncbi:MAG: hypothetical protein ACERLM_03865 [Acidimicrobiales bacterium]
MTTTTHPPTTAPPTRSRRTIRPTTRKDGFDTVTSETSLGYNTPQLVARKLWLPMFALALMGWAVGFVLAIVEAGTDRTDLATLQTLSHLVPAFMFVGFLGVFSAITFAIARILGTFRRGGGEVQATAGVEVQTLKMPGTAKAMLGLMAMGMMVMVAGIVTNFVAAGSFDGVTAADITDSAAWSAAASGLRRMGVALYLTGIAFGLGTIIEVLRFQATRVGEVASEAGHTPR